MGIRNGFKDILIVDDQGKIEYFNISNMNLFGLKPEEMIGTKPQQHYSNINDETSTLMWAVREGKTSLGVVQNLNTMNGTIVQQESDTFCIKNGDEIIGAIEFAYYDEDGNEHAVKPEKNKLYPKIGDFVGESSAMKDVRKKLKKIVDIESPVLILGETGTGKEMTARAIHNSSHRKNGNFVYVNCSALPENLFESILFGVKKGSFTDAAEREGLFSIADNGTIFLDEIQSMPLAAQGKILRVLEEKRIRPIGGDEEVSVDVRIIASCNLDTKTILSCDSMRKDLYFRLSVIQLELMPLRSRKGDVPLLVDYYLEKFNSEIEDRSLRTVDEETMAFFESYSWPGNIRELRNTLESAFYVAKGNCIRFCDVEERFRKVKPKKMAENSAAEDFIRSGKNLKTYISDYQKKCIQDTMKQHKGNIREAAHALGMTEQTLKYNLKKHGGTDFA